MNIDSNQSHKATDITSKPIAPKRRVSLKNAASDAACVIICLGLIAIMFPHAAHAQEAAFMAALETYEKVIYGYEQKISKYTQQIDQHEQQVIAPATQIANTQNWLMLAQGQYNGWFYQVNGISLNSASTPLVSAFEAAIQNGGASLSIGDNYTKVYGSQPSANAVSQSVASSVDAADTSAEEALTLANSSDAMSQYFIKSANNMESAAASSAPGNSSLVQAQAQAMQLYSNAIMHRLLASMLRQQAERLGEMGEQVKNAAAAHNAAMTSFGIGGGL